MTLSIIIPLYNEEKLVLNTLEAVMELPFPAYLSGLEVVIVDDGSSDGSFDVVQNYAASRDNVKVIQHKKNQGKGAAVHTGIKASTGNIIVIQDADMELLPNDICTMLDAMTSLNVSFVNGSRYLAGVNRPLFSFWRYCANQFFTILTSILMNVKLTDIACGYKMFTKEFIEDINLQEKRFGFEAELIIKAIRKSSYRQIAEVPVHYSPRNEAEGKKIKNSDAFKIFNTIFKYGFLRMK